MRFYLTILLALHLHASAAEQPNIIVVLADDFGWGDIGTQGGVVPTPELDRMAAEGTRFTQFYVASPICSASRAALVTGLFPGRVRINSFLQTRKGNAECGQADFLDPKFPSLPRELKAAGYATAHIGKWHLGGGRDVDNAPKFSAYGYDLGLGTWESPEPDPDLTATDWIWSPKDKVKRWDRSRWMVDRTLDFLKMHQDKPVFVNLWFDDTHTPWVPDDAADPKAETPGQFKSVLTEMDRQIGRLLATLREAKGRETLVLFFGDNGALPTFAQKRVGGMRGSKLSLYEGGDRVPCIAWQPGKIPAGRVDQESVIGSVDLFPTLAKIAGASSPTETDGEDVAAALAGNSIKRTRPLLWEYGRNPDSFKYPQGRNRSPNLAIRDGKWKLLIQDDGTSAALYDLETDANETHNVAGGNADLVSRLSSTVLAWRKSLP
ncbi:MAG: sulfatase-like hydrolase/transferase [Luteolibacter sp.]|uniref:sulfatase family protein n=1 Tax=Luteolibacter sp. TaxID=1962973 RepID=UPI003264CF7A